MAKKLLHTSTCYSSTYLCRDKSTTKWRFANNLFQLNSFFCVENKNYVSMPLLHFHVRRNDKLQKMLIHLSWSMLLFILLTVQTIDLSISLKNLLKLETVKNHAKQLKQDNLASFGLAYICLFSSWAQVYIVIYIYI